MPNNDKNGGCALILILVVIFGYISWNVYYTYGTGGTITATVNEKYTKRSGDADYFYVATDKGVFINQDSLLRAKWNSADVNANLKVGETYHISYYGWRWPFFSWFPNIVTVCDGCEDH